MRYNMNEASFYIDNDGQKIKCDIVSMITHNGDIYVAFTDYQKIDGEDIIQYGKAVLNNDDYYLVDFQEDSEIIEKLKIQIMEDVLSNLRENDDL